MNMYLFIINFLKLIKKYYRINLYINSIMKIIIILPILIILLFLLLNKKETFSYSYDDIHGPPRDASYRDLQERINIVSNF